MHQPESGNRQFSVFIVNNRKPVCSLPLFQCAWNVLARSSKVIGDAMRLLGCRRRLDHSRIFCQLCHQLQLRRIFDELAGQIGHGFGADIERAEAS